MIKDFIEGTMLWIINGQQKEIVGRKKVKPAYLSSAARNRYPDSNDRTL